MNRLFRNALNIIIGIGWAAVVAIGGWRLLHFDSTAGVPARPPLTWPADSHLTRTPDMGALVLTIHPHCPCSRATIEELAKLMTDASGKLQATIVMIRPAGAAPGWEQTDLWRSAAAIPGVSVVADEQGREARRFGCETSGQALLYGADGRLLFCGGITESRGHEGDNAGRSAILAMVLDPGLAARRQPPSTPVYGCPLFDDHAACLSDGSESCHK